MIDIRNKDHLESFIQDNITEYNKNAKQFTSKNLKKIIKDKTGTEKEPKYTSTDIDVYLSKRFASLLENPIEKQDLDKELSLLKGSKTIINEKLSSIANKHLIKKSELQKYYKSLLEYRIYSTYIDCKKFRESILDRVLKYYEFINKKKDGIDCQIGYIKTDLKQTLEKSLQIALSGGFTRNTIDIDSGTKIANEGDSAQFLFLARAILAGFTCSNVDVRSSRYDAIIDYKGCLLRVQVKGISGSSIALKDRDRGGAGIDTNADRNKGKYISSKDTDLYVAVDKQFGICYLIPTTIIEEWIETGKQTMAVSKLEDYKENWDVVSDVAKSIASKK